MKAPNCCPMCGETKGWKLIDTTKKGVSGGKALLGGLLLGPIGLAAGALGKKKSLYVCTECSFSNEYDGEPQQIKSNIDTLKSDGFKNTGLNAVWIDMVAKATPLCPFCELPQDLYIKSKGADYIFKCTHCNAEYQCSFTFGGKVKSNSVIILKCGDINKNSYQVGSCNPILIVKDISKINNSI